MITGPKGVSTSVDRFSGYSQALDEAGLSQYERVFFGAFTQASGYELTANILAEPPTPTAIFGANNFISIGVLKALRDHQIEVPAHVSVVGFDDLPPNMVVDPFITVAAQPAYEMGARATELLLSRIGSDKPVHPKEINFPIAIIERQSSGPPRAVN